MAKYSVLLIEIVRYTVEVDADDKASAEDIAKELWASSQNPTLDFSGYGEGVECDDVELVAP